MLGRNGAELRRVTEPLDGLPRYRLLTGPDDESFCRRVSEMLALGSELHGGPTLGCDGERIVAGQALVWPQTVTGQPATRRAGR